MKTVIAITTGFYIGRRRAGTTFAVPDDLDYSWFKEVKAEAPKPDATLRLPQKGKPDGRSLV